MTPGRRETTRMRRAHIAMRTCVGCREVAPRASMVRVAFAAGGLVTGPASGRGAYVHAVARCVDAAARGGLARSFRRAIPADAIRSIALEMSPTDDNPDSKLAGLSASAAVESPRPHCKGQSKKRCAFTR